MDEGHVGGVLSYWIEDNFLIPDVKVSFVGEWRRIRSYVPQLLGSRLMVPVELVLDPVLEVEELVLV